MTSEEVTENIQQILLPSLHVILFLGLSDSTTSFAADQIRAFTGNKVIKYVFMDIGIR